MIETIIVAVLPPEGLAILAATTTLISEILGWTKGEDHAISQAFVHFAKRLGRGTKGDESAERILKELNYLHEQLDEVRKGKIGNENPFENLGRGR